MDLFYFVGSNKSKETRKGVEHCVSDKCFGTFSLVSAPQRIIYQTLPPAANNNRLCDKSCSFSVPQISELSDLADRPLVGALTSRLQALHTQLQAFVEQVDSLGKAPAGGRDPQVEGESPLASPCASLPCSGDGQDGPNTPEQKVQDKKLTPPLHSLSLCLCQVLSISFFFKLLPLLDLYLLLSLVCFVLFFGFAQCLTISLAEQHPPIMLLKFLLTTESGFPQRAQI